MDGYPSIPPEHATPEAQEDIRKELWGLFDWSPPRISFGLSGQPSQSTNSRGPAVYDRHLPENLILKRIVHVKHLHRKIAAVAAAKADQIFESGGLAPTDDTFRNKDDREEMVGNWTPKAYDEKSIQGLYGRVSAQLCCTVASGLLLHPHYFKQQLLQYQEDNRSGPKAICDGFYRFKDIVTVERSTSGELVASGIPKYVRPDKRQELARVVHYCPTILTWEFKSLSVGDHHAMFALQLIASGFPGLDPFIWDTCAGPPDVKCKHHPIIDSHPGYDSEETIAFVNAEVQVRQSPAGRDVVLYPSDSTQPGAPISGHSVAAEDSARGSGDPEHDEIVVPPSATESQDHATSDRESIASGHLKVRFDLNTTNVEEPGPADRAPSSEDGSDESYRSAHSDEASSDESYDSYDSSVSIYGTKQCDIDLNKDAVFLKKPWINGLFNLKRFDPDEQSQIEHRDDGTLEEDAEKIVNRALERSGTDIDIIREMQGKLKAEWKRELEARAKKEGGRKKEAGDASESQAGPQTKKKRKKKQFDDDSGLDKDAHGYRQTTAYHVLQQSWSQAVKENVTVFIIHSGNYEFLCIRERKTQTMYMSDLLHPQALNDPGYGQVLVGACILAYDDAVRRSVIHEAQNDGSRTDGSFGAGYSSGSSSGSSDEATDSEASDDYQSKSRPPKRSKTASR